MSDAEKLSQALAALQELVAQVSQYKRHGNPGFPYRVESYLAIQQAQTVLRDNGLPYATLDQKAK